jgi:hypothetical protein
MHLKPEARNMHLRILFFLFLSNYNDIIQCYLRCALKIVDSANSVGVFSLMFEFEHKIYVDKWQ